MSLIKKLTGKTDTEGKLLLNCPKFLESNLCYETYMGSTAYGVATDNSDADIYGFCIPPKDMIFPHLNGEIMGFGRQHKRFEQYQQHHIKDGEVEYDFAIYGIVKYFQLCMENNPNMIDSLFTPENCVTHSNEIGMMVRDARKGFLHKGSWHKYRGYAHKSLHKMKSKNPKGLTELEEFSAKHDIPASLKLEDVTLEIYRQSLGSPSSFGCTMSLDELKEYETLLKTSSKRAVLINKFGYDTKYAYHTVRLLNQVEQIMAEGDMDLQRSREQLKEIRRGEWSHKRIADYFEAKSKSLEELYASSKLRHTPDEETIKQLLLNCLEHHYGNLSKCVVIQDKYEQALKDIQCRIEKTLV